MSPRKWGGLRPCHVPFAARINCFICVSSTTFMCPGECRSIASVRVFGFHTGLNVFRIVEAVQRNTRQVVTWSGLAGPREQLN